MMQGWPRYEPVTQRWICRWCWNGTHRVVKYSVVTHRREGLKDACEGECHCVHRDDDVELRKERTRIKDARAKRREEERAQLEDPNNPLRAINLDFEPRYLDPKPKL